MQWWQRIKSWWPGSRRQFREADLARELQTHLESEAEEQQEAGASSKEARLAAQRALGNTTLIKEDVRVMWGFQWLETLFQDLRYTLRTLKRDRGFTLIAILILGLGIGANVAVFSVVNTILLRPLPFANAKQLVWIAPPATKCGFSCETYSADAFQEFRSWNHSFTDVAGYFAFSTEDNYRLMGRGVPVPATAIYVTRSFFKCWECIPRWVAYSCPRTRRKAAISWRC